MSARVAGPPGTGGRCAHLALCVAAELAGERGWVLLSGGTDGQDGPCDAAGAVVDGGTAARGAQAGARAEEHAARFDSHGFFARERRGALRTGLTGTNVMDLHLLFCFPEPPEAGGA
jgi:glycerate 2-kinase